MITITVTRNGTEKEVYYSELTIDEKMRLLGATKDVNCIEALLRENNPVIRNALFERVETLPVEILQLLFRYEDDIETKKVALERLMDDESYTCFLAFANVFFGPKFALEYLRWQRHTKLTAALYLWHRKYNRQLAGFTEDFCISDISGRIDSKRIYRATMILSLYSFLPLDTFNEAMSKSKESLSSAVRAEICETREWYFESREKFLTVGYHFDDWLEGLANLLIIDAQSANDRERYKMIRKAYYKTDEMWLTTASHCLISRYKDYTGSRYVV